MDADLLRQPDMQAAGPGAAGAASGRLAPLLPQSLPISAAGDPWRFGGLVVLLLFCGSVLLLLLLAALAACCGNWRRCLNPPATPGCRDRLEMKERAGAADRQAAD